MSKKLLIVDFDTPIVRSAMIAQTNYVAIHQDTGDEFPIQTQKGFLEKIAPEFHNKFKFEWKPQPLKPSADNTENKEILHHPEYIGMHTVNKEVERIIAATEYWAYDVKFVIHKEGNHRNEIATIAKYKGNRKEKPIFYQHVKDHAIKKFEDKVILAVNEETDDLVAQFMYKEYLRVGERKEHFNVVLGHVDKDIDQCIGWHYNFDKNNLYWIDRIAAAKQFYLQCIMGDASDNIKGIVDLPKDVKEKYGIWKGKGVGEKSAVKLLEDCDTPQKMLQRIVDLYRIQYPDNWFDVLQENCRLLYLKRTPEDNYCLQSKLDLFKVEY